MTEARAMLIHAGMDREIPQTSLQPDLPHFVFVMEFGVGMYIMHQ